MTAKGSLTVAIKKTRSVTCYLQPNDNTTVCCLTIHFNYNVWTVAIWHVLFNSDFIKSAGKGIMQLNLAPVIEICWENFIWSTRKILNLEAWPDYDKTKCHIFLIQFKSCVLELSHHCCSIDNWPLWFLMIFSITSRKTGRGLHVRLYTLAFL